jgi:hypothetical protein
MGAEAKSIIFHSLLEIDLDAWDWLDRSRIVRLPFLPNGRSSGIQVPLPTRHRGSCDPSEISGIAILILQFIRRGVGRC